MYAYIYHLFPPPIFVHAMYFHESIVSCVSLEELYLSVCIAPNEVYEVSGHLKELWKHSRQDKT